MNKLCCIALFACLLLPLNASPQVVLKNNVHTWESVGEVIEVSGKTVTLRQKLKLSEATWSLLPGAVAEAKQLTNGDQVHAKGSTLPDGTYDTKRIFLIAESSTRQTATGGGVVQGADHGAPESQQVPRGVTDPGGPGLEGRGRTDSPGSRVPTGRPGGAKGPVGGLQSSRGSTAPRFLPGDVEGIVEQVAPQQLVLTQTVFVDKESTVVGTTGEVLKGKDLKPGLRVAVTINDVIDPKTQSRRAAVIRILPK
jgi:putative ubiquitin-RnfH superfamily antitoxin RatB of RatAB toxin-antitoxin module